MPKRYLFTCARNNTKVRTTVWNKLSLGHYRRMNMSDRKVDDEALPGWRAKEKHYKLCRVVERKVSSGHKIVYKLVEYYV